MTDYVIRNDKTAKMYGSTEDKEVNVKETLKNYPYLVKSMKEEKYSIRENYCFILDEILCGDKVVGFATLQLKNMELMMLRDCYILPEFRGQGLFYTELCKLNFISPEFGIMQPTRKLVELLIDYSFAKKVDNNIVVSGIDLYFDEFNVKTNKKEHISYEIPHSNFYDLAIYSTILVLNGEVFYHNQLKEDIKDYGKRKKLSKHYFKSVKKQLKRNKNEYAVLIESMGDELPEDKITYEEIVGDGEGLSDFLQAVVDSEIISYDEALEIKEQIIDEYESGEIDDETIDGRIRSLITGEDDILSDLDLDDNLLELLEDNKELSNEVIKAILEDDHDKFVELMEDAMDRDEEFSDKVYNFDGDYDDEPDIDVYGEDINLNFPGLNLNSHHPIADMMWGGNNGKYKLDNTYYGKDYPISHDNHIFNVLNTLKKNNNLNLALKKEDMAGQMTAQFVEKILFEWELVSGKVSWDDWDEYANDNLTVNDLKDILRKHKLKVSGRKQELIDRIRENQIPLDEFTSQNLSVTKEGEEFIKENRWINTYNKVLDKFDFNDYSKYLDEHNGELKKLTHDYIEKHLKLAEKENNNTYINDCINAEKLLSSL